MSETEISKAAKTLSKLGASKGGLARAEKMTPEERKEVASKAASARWGVPKAEHVGAIHIGDVSFPCSVLSDGTRILTQNDFMHGMGMYYSGWVANQQAKDERAAALPHFLAFKSLEPFVLKHLGELQSITVKYRTKDGTNVAHGIKAEIIPTICEVWIDADRYGRLGPRQKKIAEKADIMLRALAHVGIIALVDEATGYQEVRDRDALHKILEAYVTKEQLPLLPWSKRFPDEFYKQVFRLKGWKYVESNPRKGPRAISQITNKLVYEQLPRGVLDELRRKNPVVYNHGRRKYRHHEFLTSDIGNPYLEKQVASITTLLRAAPNWRVFKLLFDRAFPGPNMQIEMTLDEEIDIWEVTEKQTE